MVCKIMPVQVLLLTCPHGCGTSTPAQPTPAPLSCSAAKPQWLCGGAVLPEPRGLFTFSITSIILHPISTPSHYGTSTLLVSSKQNSSEMFDIQFHRYTKLKERAHHDGKSPLFVNTFSRDFSSLGAGSCHTAVISSQNEIQLSFLELAEKITRAITCCEGGCGLS